MSELLTKEIETKLALSGAYASKMQPIIRFFLDIKDDVEITDHHLLELYNNEHLPMFGEIYKAMLSGWMTKAFDQGDIKVIVKLKEDNMSDRKLPEELNQIAKEYIDEFEDKLIEDMILNFKKVTEEEKNNLYEDLCKMLVEKDKIETKEELEVVLKRDNKYFNASIADNIMNRIKYSFDHSLPLEVRDIYYQVNPPEGVE